MFCPNTFLELHKNNLDSSALNILFLVLMINALYLNKNFEPKTFNKVYFLLKTFFAGLISDRKKAY